MEQKAVTLVVGGGMTGLTAAYLLARSGEPTVLVERGQRIGGLARTFQLDGITFDLGPHIFFHDDDCEAGQLLYELLQERKYFSRRFRYAIQSKGKYWRMPASVMDIPGYPIRYSIDLVKCNLLNRSEKSEGVDSDSLQASLESKTGGHLYRDLFQPLAVKKTNISGEQIHRDWQQRTERTIHNRVDRTDTPTPPVKRMKNKLMELLGLLRYHYPEEGFEVFAQELWKRYQSLGGTTLLNSGELSINRENDRIDSVQVGEKHFKVKNLVWTAPINILNQLLGRETAAAPAIDMAVLFLTYNIDKPRKRPYVYTYHVDEDLIFNRIYYPASIYRESPPGIEGICLEINDFSDLQTLSNEELVARAAADVERIGLFPRDSLRQHQVRWIKNCIPLYTLDYEARLEEIFKGVKEIDNLYSVGRSGGHYFSQTPASVKQGVNIARHLIQNSR